MFIIVQQDNRFEECKEWLWFLDMEPDQFKEWWCSFKNFDIFGGQGWPGELHRIHLLFEEDGCEEDSFVFVEENWSLMERVLMATSDARQIPEDCWFACMSDHHESFLISPDGEEF
tara:strand:+ start:320 stop:667 length:348 start_codon:yes stop_codon:yes gene_type:complete